MPIYIRTHHSTTTTTSCIADGRTAQCVDRRFARRTEVFRRFVQIRCSKGSAAAGQYAAEASGRQSACRPVQYAPA
ncbi:Uncharacterised protein [Neisseria meningitidis]|nr:Uncharacterised protein [Neisseria meningitidis]